MQTLRIDYCPRLKELPKDLENLISLRHLDIDRQYIEQLPINMGRLTCLQTLPFFVISQDIGYRIEELGCLSQLQGEFRIDNLEHVKDKKRSQNCKFSKKDKSTLVRISLE